MLAMKVAMNKLKKVDYTSSVEMAKRILSLIGDEDDDLSEKCKKILSTGNLKGCNRIWIYRKWSSIISMIVLENLKNVAVVVLLFLVWMVSVLFVKLVKLSDILIIDILCVMLNREGFKINWNP